MFDACNRAAVMTQRDGLGLVTFLLENTAKMLERDALVTYGYITPPHREQVDLTQRADDDLVETVFVYGQSSARWTSGYGPEHSIWDYPSDMPRIVTCETYGGQFYDRVTGRIMYRLEIFPGDEKLLVAN
jgi:hypothetical protein